MRIRWGTVAREVSLGFNSSARAWAASRLPSPRLFAVLAGFGLITAIGVLTFLTQDWQGEIGTRLAQSARHHFARGELASLAQAGVLAGLWFLWLVARPLVILVAFFAVEWILAGPPRSWSNSLLCLGAQVSLVVLYYFINPWLQMVLPTDAVEPLLRLSSEHLPRFLAPIAPWLLLIAMLALYGLAGYWTHRAQHRIPLLWRFHRVHHSIPHMDAMNDVAHPIDAIGDRIGFILISALIGFDYETTAFIFAFRNMRGRLLHTRAPINFGPLGKIFVDNRFHISHHSVREKYWDCNFGNAIILYDQLFGTYVEPDWKDLEETGLDKTAPPNSLWQFFSAQLEDRTSGPEEGTQDAPLASPLLPA